MEPIANFPFNYGEFVIYKITVDPINWAVFINGQIILRWDQKGLMFVPNWIDKNQINSSSGDMQGAFRKAAQSLEGFLVEEYGFERVEHFKFT